MHTPSSPSFSQSRIKTLTLDIFSKLQNPKNSRKGGVERSWRMLPMWFVVVATASGLAKIRTATTATACGGCTVFKVR
ncbi:hypothetical protein M6B38_328230 [Iris pallida]|uniref:Uncharacterized protein n=1 Tax=Iris pallida TaxID=29817 RepID=A0AAX6DW79_IRIPA|nr:hypothetical protein M6B38_224055 [Iris pallida]KAJ6836372.1 hypothetical protein M6B38_328230 [Iris pallida]